jgi:hypothetical protein
VGKIIVGDYMGNLKRHFYKFASNTVSQRRRYAQALLTLCSGFSAMFLLSLLVTNHDLLTNRFCRAKAVDSVRRSGESSRLPGNPKQDPPKTTSFHLLRQIFSVYALGPNSAGHSL